VLEALEELGRADLVEHLPNAKLHPEPQYEDFEPQYPYYGRESASLYKIRIRALHTCEQQSPHAVLPRQRRFQIEIFLECSRELRQV
jgi:hypothetical protein